MQAYESYDDLTLFTLISQGDEAAFKVIFYRHKARLNPFIFSMLKSENDAKEIIQEVFLKCWTHREKLPSVEKPGAWLHTLAANAIFDFLKSQARYAGRLKRVPQAEPATDNLADELDARYTQTLIREAVEQLPLRRREVFRMARMEGKSRREIAEELNISEHTVHSQLADAMKSVQDYLIRKGAMYIPAVLLLLKDF